MKTYPVWKQVVGGLIGAILLVFIRSKVLADNPTEYRVTKDETLSPIKRTVEATLSERVDKETLGQLATQIRDSSDDEFNLTFIGWRIEGENSDTYWANTRFDPDMKIDIIGTHSDK